MADFAVTREEMKDSMRFGHLFLKMEDAYVPGWSNTARTLGSKTGQPRRLNMKLDETGDLIVRMDYVLVK